MWMMRKIKPNNKMHGFPRYKAYNLREVCFSWPEFQDFDFNDYISW